jgi:hypothetical protein
MERGGGQNLARAPIIPSGPQADVTDTLIKLNTTE